MKLSVDVHKRLGSFQLDVSFETESGRLALLGASGCGKSVTLGCIAGIIHPDEGCIRLGDEVLFDSKLHIDLPPQKRRVGYLFQQYALFPTMTVRQNIESAILPRKNRKEKAGEVMRRFGLLDVAGQKPSSLSGGQAQRTALARMLATEPRLILLDEPFSALDSYIKYQVETQLADILDPFPGPVVMVSHDRGEVWRTCTKVCVIDKGKSEPVVTLDELFHHPTSEAAARLSGCKNWVDVVPQGTNVRVPAWHVCLQASDGVSSQARRAGIRAHHVVPAKAGDVNVLDVRVSRVIEDVFSTIILLSVEGAEADAPLLRMEMEKQDWKKTNVPAGTFQVSIRPDDIMLF